jgi:hypothetical protein
MEIKINYCLVWVMKHDGRLPALGKHEDHLPHYWWATNKGGGHQLYAGWEPDGKQFNDGWALDSHEGEVRKWLCPGRKD